LLNYYFRSKEKLFAIIMAEKVQQMFAFIAPTLNEADTTLDEKIDVIATRYIEMLLKNPDLPLFCVKRDKARSGAVCKNGANGNLCAEVALYKANSRKKTRC
jgi:AcrR family transcriptional regulator